MFSKLREFYIPVLVQIALPYMLLALALSAGATYITTRLIVDSVEERFTNQLFASAVQVEDSLVRKEEELLADLRLLSNIQGVAAALQSNDAAQLQTLLLPVALNDGVEYLGVVSAEAGPLLSAALGPSGYLGIAPPSGLLQLPLVTDVLAGREDAGGDKYAQVLPLEGGAYLVLSGPIRQDGVVVGALLLGRSVQSLAAALREESLAQVSFYAADGQLLASSLAQPRPLSSAQAQAVNRSEESGSLILPLAEERITYNELNSVWAVRDGQPAGIVGVSLATNFLVQATQFSRTNTLILTMASLVLVILVGVWLAGRITEPLSRLKRAAQRAAAGDLSASVPVDSNDEIGVLGRSFNHMLGSLSRSKQELLGAYERTIEGWARATDLRDHETEGHSRRVAELTVELARRMGLNGEQLVTIRRGALLHDIGKIALPDSILLKPGPLTAEEIGIMRRHPEHARSFIERIDFLKPALAIPYHHHERWDGSGYPLGLKAQEIPLEARIFAVVDVWDALTSDRPYRKAMAREEARAHIAAGAGSHFDPQVLATFQEMIAG
jgi:putative nucleotidyltransferase with HDIG domain